jgi:hypothetical protein
MRSDQRTERLGDATFPDLKRSTAPVLSETDRLAGKTREVHALARGERSFEEGASRHLTVGGYIGEHTTSGTKLLERRRVGGHRSFDRSQLGSGERPPSAAHLLPDRCFRVVHPVSVSDRDGRRWSVVSGHAIELCYPGNRQRKYHRTSSDHFAGPKRFSIYGSRVDT